MYNRTGTTTAQECGGEKSTAERVMNLIVAWKMRQEIYTCVQ